ncbi:hypothetical protein PBAL39_23827 [Pedobacter sp. BAL39]|uniref:DUF5000 domain-containing lipoprotein n=1 Tax=Pedobacter sp. BAL39 TaxID=391596 RepID=UPI0001559656|nr:DUF5000 domain-containing lipoprotein [Pedobacter sp. BAL39]EDM36091.1 hypothetical protein PBAL39_23827 [Pedobacter sp. BAL39]
MKRLQQIIMVLLLALVWLGCKEEPRIDHIDENAPAPGQVSNVKTESTPGGAIVTYRIPADENLSYVKAVYEIQPGVFKEGKASYYTDTIRLEGFGDTREYNVQLFSVGKNEKASAPVDVKVTPLTPPVYVSFKDLTLEAGFGGVKIKFQNEYQANLAIVLRADTVGNGVMLPVQTFYTKARSGSFSVRGLSPTEKNFSVYLRDRWNNKSDELEKTLTPLFEQQVPKPFTALRLPNDEQIPVEPQYPLEKMWDGVIDGGIFASRHSSVLPQWFTIDLNRSVVVSRMKMHQRTPNYTYGGGNVKTFELYGSNNPSADGSWDNWTLLSKFESYKPSGLPLGQVSSEDYNYGHTLGEDFELEETPAAYRYYRFKTLATYGGGPQITIAELSFWGKF